MRPNSAIAAISSSDTPAIGLLADSRALADRPALADGIGQGAEEILPYAS